MAKISEFPYQALVGLSKQAQAISGRTIEEAAQTFTSLIYNQFQESMVLTRVFATIPFGRLPSGNQSFVMKLAANTGITDQIGDTTPVLSLIGSSGARPEWNDRRKSAGHVGIPLASSSFIDAIPMMSRLLKQLGMNLTWLDDKDLGATESVMGRLSGIFHVSEASTEVDEQGRKIIAAQDFVVSNRVKSVFGTGGAYPASDTFVVNINFTTEYLEKSQAAQFNLLFNSFKTATHKLNSAGALLA